MKKVLILNGHQYYDVVAKGDLTNHYIDCANKFFEENGFEVKQTHIEKGYTIQEEVEKFKWADYIISISSLLDEPSLDCKKIY